MTERIPRFLTPEEFATWGTGEIIPPEAVREGEIVEVTLRAELFSGTNGQRKLVFATHGGEGSMALPARAIVRRISHG